FDIAEHWHIYWENPGDAGLPTKVEFILPEGLSVGPIQYPAPISFPSPGDIESFGYEGHAFLFARLGGQVAGEKEAEIKATASWLACKDSCIKQSGEATLAWGRSMTGESLAALETARARIPQSASARGWVASWSDDYPPVLSVDPGEDRIAMLFPADPKSWIVGGL